LRRKAMMGGRHFQTIEEAVVNWKKCGKVNSDI